MYDLSLVICTRNRAARLAETLKRVLAIRSRIGLGASYRRQRIDRSDK